MVQLQQVVNQVQALAGESVTVYVENSGKQEAYSGYLGGYRWDKESGFVEVFCAGGVATIREGDAWHIEVWTQPENWERL